MQQTRMATDAPLPAPASPGVSGDDLAASLRRGAAETLSYDPFFHFEVERFLPEPFYRELLANFPEGDRVAEVTEGDKMRLNSRRSPDAFAAFCREVPVWTALFEQLASASFQACLYDIVHDGLRLSRGAFGARPWQTGPKRVGTFERLRRQDAYVSFEFSRLGPGACAIARPRGRTRSAGRGSPGAARSPHPAASPTHCA